MCDSSNRAHPPTNGVRPCSSERTRRLVDEVGARSVDYAARYAVLAECDIVVSATASPHVVVEAERVRLAHPVVSLDLAVPRDVDPSLAVDPRVTLVSIDTIGELAEGDQIERSRLEAKAMAIIRDLHRAYLA